MLLWGRPGVGKSSFIEGLAGEELRVVTLIASIHDPTDFSGLPVLHQGRVRYAAPEWVEELAAGPDGILFLDELSTAPPSVQAALLRVVFERRVGFTPLPEGVRIVAAANPPDLMVGGWELSPPLRNRFVHLEWDIPEALYLRSLTHGWERATLPTVDPVRHTERLPDWKARIGGFMRVRPDSLHSSPEESSYGFASPRSWDYATALLCSCDLLGYSLDGEGQGVVLSLVAGCLGEATAIPLVEYLANLRLPDPLAVLRGEATVDVEDLDDAELYVTFFALNARMLGVLEEPGRLVAYSHVYLDLAQRVFADGRRDVIFVPLQELARAGWLLRLTGAGSREQIMQAVAELFGDEAFGEFVEVLG